MDNSTTATLQGDLLLVTELELVTPTTVAGTLYGIAFTLFCLYVHSLVPRLRDGDRKKQARFMLGYSVLVMLCGLYNLVGNAWVTQNAYIKHSTYPGGPYLYILTTYHVPAITIIMACQVAIDILTSAIQIWRVWIIWGATRYSNFIIVLPSLCFLTFAALALRTVILETTLPGPEVIRLDTKTEIAGSAVQGATTILCTAFISLFLIFQQWRQRRLIGRAQGSGGYMKIAAMLIESYALESIWVFMVGVLTTLNPVGSFFTETKAYIEIIAYLLVQYRVASGKAYESQRGQSTIGSLHWNRSTNHVTTQFGEMSEAGSHRDCVPTKPEVSDTSSMA